MHTPLKYGTLTIVTIVVAVVSVVINVVLAYIGSALSNPPATFGPYMHSSIIGLTIGGIIAAAVVYALMRTFITDTAKANRYFIIVSIIALIVSFYPDVAMPWSSDPDQIGWTYGIMANLMLMHVVAAVLVMRSFTSAQLA